MMRNPNPSSQDGQPQQPPATPTRRIIRPVGSSMPPVITPRAGPSSSQIRTLVPNMRSNGESPMMPPRGRMEYGRNLMQPGARMQSTPQQRQQFQRLPQLQGQSSQGQGQQASQGHQQHQRPQMPQLHPQQMQRSQMPQLHMQQAHQQRPAMQQLRQQLPQSAPQQRQQPSQGTPQQRQQVPQGTPQQHQQPGPYANMTAEQKRHAEHRQWLVIQQHQRQIQMQQQHQQQQQQGQSSHTPMRGTPGQTQTSPPASAYNTVPSNHPTPRGNGNPVHPGLPAYNPGPSSSSQPMLQQYSMDGSPYPLYYSIPQPWNPRPSAPQPYMHQMSQYPYSAPYSDNVPSSSTAPPNRKRAAAPYGASSSSYAPKRCVDETTFMIDGTPFDMAHCPIIEQRRNPNAATPVYMPKASTSERVPRKTAPVVRRPPPNPAQDVEMEPVPSDDEAEPDNGELVVNEAVLASIFNHPEAKKKSFSKEAMEELLSSTASMMEDYITEAFATAEARFEYENSEEAIESAGQFNFMMKYYAALDRKERQEANPTETEGESSGTVAPSTNEASLAAIGSVQRRPTEVPEPKVEEPVPNVPTVTYRDVGDVLYDDPVLHHTPLGYLAVIMRPNDISEEIKRLEAEAEELAIR